MTIDYGGLYGPGQAAGDAPASADAAQVATFRIPRTDPPGAPLSPPFVASGVSIDNATGRWWRVAGRWIPPWTIGAAVRVDPPTAQLSVEALTPAGQLSEATGEELVVVATTEHVAQNPGIYRPPTAAVTYESAYQVAFYGNAAPAALVVAGVAGERLAIASTAIFASELEAQGYRIRGPVRVELRERVSGRSLFAGAISPEQPTVQLQAEPGAVMTVAGEGIELVASATGAVGAGLVDCWLLFYRVAAA